MELKPQDIVIALKVASLEMLNQPQSRRALSESVGLSLGEIANAFKRLGALLLLAPVMDPERVIKQKTQHFLNKHDRPEAAAARADRGESFDPAFPIQPPGTHQLNVGGMLEFLCYGVKYYSAVERTGFGRGVPTGWSCPEIDGIMIPPTTPYVWAHPSGQITGEGIAPLHASAIKASEGDPYCYSWLALVDAIRLGKPREVSAAKDELKKRMEAIYAWRRFS